MATFRGYQWKKKKSRSALFPGRVIESHADGKVKKAL